MTGRGCLNATLDAAIAQRMFPGAAALIARGGDVLLCAGRGRHTSAPDAALVTPATIYDLASLTKLFTAAAALRLVAAGVLDLDAPLTAYLPTSRAAGVTIAHLLTHTSGLDLRLATLAHAGGAAAVRAGAYAAQPTHPPGRVAAYTNVNTFLLGEVVGLLAGNSLDRAIDALVCAPLGLASVSFCPAAAIRTQIPPTEADDLWRGGLVWGSVHDESAHALAGVAGHAGLFGMLADLHRFACVWLPGASFLPEELRQRALTNQTPQLPTAAGLGWMMDRANFMGDVPGGTVGHTGFTGTALVIEPASQTIVVLLSNRTYPRRDGPRPHKTMAMLVALALDA